MGDIRVEPQDGYNGMLVRNVHPDDWVNPEPAGRYNLVVIGAGTAGLVTAAGAAGLGAKVALVERHLMGGDCLNAGCVPSKCLIRSAHAVGAVREAGEFGVNVGGKVVVDFAAVMERMRKLRGRISKHDSVKRFSELGVDVFLGEGRFGGEDVVEVDGKKLRFARAVIATGARAVWPEVKGLEQAGGLTNETVFSLAERPGRMAVVGGGPLGCEMAQVFARLGCKVTLIEQAGHIMSREDRDAAAMVAEAFERDRIDVLVNSTLKQVTVEEGQKVLRLDCGEVEKMVAADEILLGAGRRPNVEELNLEGVGVEYDLREGVQVDDRLRTSNKRIFAAGDVCLKYKFTHTADFAARIVLQNALFWGRKKLSALTIPWCTYTDPAVAHVGLTAEMAKAQGLEIDTYMKLFSEVDRAIADGQENGMVKVHVRKGTDKIVGATIVAGCAGDMISEITLAMVAGVGLGTIANVIHPYPTQAEAIRQVGDLYNRTRLTPGLKKVFERILQWRR